MRAGLRLRWFGCGDPDYSLADLVAFIAALPPESVVWRARMGDDAAWSLQADLLALVADQLALFRWQMTAGSDQAKPPLVSRFARQATTVSPPAVESDCGEVPDLNDRNTGGRFTGEVRSTAQIAEQLGWD